MTNLEILQGSNGLGYELTQQQYEAALTKNGLVPSDEYVAENAKAIDLAISDLIPVLITAYKKLQDDGFSIEMQSISDLWALRAWYRAKWGLPDDRPTTGAKLYNATIKW